MPVPVTLGALYLYSLEELLIVLPYEDKPCGVLAMDFAFELHVSGCLEISTVSSTEISTVHLVFFLLSYN